tara:strand:- start:5969 stop:6166 length:198 start_codon:yes stop_codon:yes gene_type:complete
MEQVSREGFAGGEGFTACEAFAGVISSAQFDKHFAKQTPRWPTTPFCFNNASRGELHLSHTLSTT